MDPSRLLLFFLLLFCSGSGKGYVFCGSALAILPEQAEHSDTLVPTVGIALGICRRFAFAFA